MPLFRHYIELFVDHGRVGCPARNDTTIESCMSCPFLVDLELNGAGPRVLCKALPQRRQRTEFEG